MVRGVPKESCARVQAYYFNLMGFTGGIRGGSPERLAFLGMLMDIKPTSAEIRVPKDQIVKCLLAGTGFPLPKKYRHLLDDKTIG